MSYFKSLSFKKLLAPCPPHNFCCQLNLFHPHHYHKPQIFIQKLQFIFFCFRFYGRILREPSSRDTRCSSSSSGSCLPWGTSGSTSSVPLAVSNSR